MAHPRVDTPNTPNPTTPGDSYLFSSGGVPVGDDPIRRARRHSGVAGSGKRSYGDHIERVRSN